LQKATIIFLLFLHPSAWKTSASTKRIFAKFFLLGILLKFVEASAFFGKNRAKVRRRLARTFMITSLRLWEAQESRQS